MGRGPLTEPQIPASFIAESFTVGANSGELLRRDRLCDSGGYNSKFAGGSATYRDPDGVLRARLTFQGKRRNMTAARIAWILSAGVYPKGQVQTRDGGDDFRRENLTILPHCRHRPWEKGGGQASALERRAEVDRSLLAAMAEHQGASLMQLAKLVGVSEGRVSVKLNRLASRGLAQSPTCVPGRSWALTGQGREIAAAGRPLIDDLDRQVLAVLRSASMGPVRLARRLGVCLLTAKRRVRLLAARGLVIADARRFFSITEAGLAALGPDAQPPPRWVNVAAIRLVIVSSSCSSSCVIGVFRSTAGVSACIAAMGWPLHRFPGSPVSRGPTTTARCRLLLLELQSIVCQLAQISTSKVASSTEVIP
jgi:Mn-dependent DtxR family transcriptional regulator